MTITKVTLTTKEAAQYLGVSEDYMKRARITGKGAVFVKIGRRVVYRVDDLNQFMDKHTQTNLSRTC